MTRADRGARPARMARLLRERVPGDPRVLRRARPAADRSGLADPRVDRRLRRASRIGLGERHADTWQPLGRSFAEDDETPGESGADASPDDGSRIGPPGHLIAAPISFASLPPRRTGPARSASDHSPPSPEPPGSTNLRRARPPSELVGDGVLLATGSALRSRRGGRGQRLCCQHRTNRFRHFARVAGPRSSTGCVAASKRACTTTTLDGRVWHLVDLISATLRGVAANNLLHRP